MKGETSCLRTEKPVTNVTERLQGGRSASTRATEHVNPSTAAGSPRARRLPASSRPPLPEQTAAPRQVSLREALRDRSAGGLAPGRFLCPVSAPSHTASRLWVLAGSCAGWCGGGDYPPSRSHWVSVGPALKPQLRRRWKEESNRDNRGIGSEPCPMGRCSSRRLVPGTGVWAKAGPPEGPALGFL